MTADSSTFACDQFTWTRLKRVPFFLGSEYVQARRSACEVAAVPGTCWHPFIIQR